MNKTVVTAFVAAVIVAVAAFAYQSYTGTQVPQDNLNGIATSAGEAAGAIEATTPEAATQPTEAAAEAPAVAPTEEAPAAEEAAPAVSPESAPAADAAAPAADAPAAH